MVLTLVTFLIPPADGTKVTVGVANLIILCAYLLFFYSALPSGSFSTPLIGNSRNSNLRRLFIQETSLIALKNCLIFSFVLQRLIGYGDHFNHDQHIFSTFRSWPWIRSASFRSKLLGKSYRTSPWSSSTGFVKYSCFLFKTPVIIINRSNV